MKKAQLVSEILGDFLLPLLGYIWWGWDLYFILLFIIFDLSVRLFFAFFRPETRSAQLLLRPSLFYLSFVILSHFYMVLTEPTWRFTTAFADFFWYQDFFIPQGLILLPILIYTECSRQRMELLTTGAFDAKSQVKKLGSRLLAATIILMLMSVCLAVFNWSENVEIVFFLSAWLLLIISENKAAFLKD
ncbi:MAG: hypothetical protein RL331_1962 [Bacteroidota bacterium]|jgi:hypothetical protein